MNSFRDKVMAKELQGQPCIYVLNNKLFRYNYLKESDEFRRMVGYAFKEGVLRTVLVRGLWGRFIEGSIPLQHSLDL